MVTFSQCWDGNSVYLVIIQLDNVRPQDGFYIGDEWSLDDLETLSGVGIEFRIV